MAPDYTPPTSAIWTESMLMEYRKTLKFTLLLALFSPMTNADAGRLYRWVDNQGHVHYGDKIPPKYIKREHVQLDKHGVAIKRVEAAKTRAQIEREAELARLRAEKQRLIEEQRAADRVLLRTFRNEDDILMARDGKIAAIDVIIQVTRGNIRRFKVKLTEMQQKAANLERAGERASPQFLQEIESTRRSLSHAYATILQKEKDKDRIRAEFAQDLKRFRELKNLRAENERPHAKQGVKYNNLLDNVFPCPANGNCAEVWPRAENFVRTYATTPLRIKSEAILMTGPPRKDTDLSITIVRLRPTATEPARLFMDLQCKQSPLGRALCNSEKAEHIHRAFRQAMAGKTVKRRSTK